MDFCERPCPKGVSFKGVSSEGLKSSGEEGLAVKQGSTAVNKFKELGRLARRVVPQESRRVGC